MSGTHGSAVTADQLAGPTLRRQAARRQGGFVGLDRRARAVAARLGASMPPGSRVLLAYPRGPELAAAFFGCLYAGMVAVPFVLSEAGRTARVGAVAERSGVTAVLTGSDSWTPVAVDRSRVEVIEADGVRVGGDQVRRLADTWKPVGVLRSAPAYQWYVEGTADGGRLEPVLLHSDLARAAAELIRALAAGTPEEDLEWVASLQGVESAVWRILLPVHTGTPLGVRP